MLSKKKASAFASQIAQKWKVHELIKHGEELKKMTDEYLIKNRYFFQLIS